VLREQQTGCKVFQFSCFYDLVSEFVSDPLCEKIVLVDFVAKETGKALFMESSFLTFADHIAAVNLFAAIGAPRDRRFLPGIFVVDVHFYLQSIVNMCENTYSLWLIGCVSAGGSGSRLHFLRSAPHRAMK